VPSPTPDDTPCQQMGPVARLTNDGHVRADAPTRMTPVDDLGLPIVGVAVARASKHRCTTPIDRVHALLDRANRERPDPVHVG
jgi:hypothetical protein